MTCPECLDIKNTTAPVYPGGYQAHPDCGWCHVPIEYEDGKKGARCADIRDDPWNCGDQYDTATCSPGWACDTSTSKCIMANPGEGFGSRSVCDNFCQGHDHGNTYRCNSTVGTCDKCEKGDVGCGPDRNVQCANCAPIPPEPDHHNKYKCNKTDTENPKCEKCPEKDSEGCQDQ